MTRKADVAPAGELIATEDLPKRILAQAELTIDENFHLNVEGDLMWRREKVPVADLASDDINDALQLDEAFAARARKIAAAMGREGQKQPIVVGPSGLEGNHRVAAALLLGWETIDAYVAVVVDHEPEEDLDPPYP